MSRGYKNNQAASVLNIIEKEDDSKSFAIDNMPVALKENFRNPLSCNFGTTIGRAVFLNNNCFEGNASAYKLLGNISAFELQNVEIFFRYLRSSNVVTVRRPFSFQTASGEGIDMNYTALGSENINFRTVAGLQTLNTPSLPAGTISKVSIKKYGGNGYANINDVETSRAVSDIKYTSGNGVTTFGGFFNAANPILVDEQMFDIQIWELDTSGNRIALLCHIPGNDDDPITNGYKDQSGNGYNATLQNGVSANLGIQDDYPFSQLGFTIQGDYSQDIQGNINDLLVDNSREFFNYESGSSKRIGQDPTDSIVKTYESYDPNDISTGYKGIQIININDVNTLNDATVSLKIYQRDNDLLNRFIRITQWYIGGGSTFLRLTSSPSNEWLTYNYTLTGSVDKISIEGGGQAVHLKDIEIVAGGVNGKIAPLSTNVNQDLNGDIIYKGQDGKTFFEAETKLLHDDYQAIKDADSQEIWFDGLGVAKRVAYSDLSFDSLNKQYYVEDYRDGRIKQVRTFEPLIEKQHLTELAIRNITKSTFLPDAEIVNLGVAGNNTVNLISRLPDVAAESPDLVIIMIGTNDMLNSTNLVTLDDYETNLQTIVTSISAYADVLFMTVLPCIESYVYSRHTYPAIEPYVSNTLNEVIDLANVRVGNIVTANSLYSLDTNAIYVANGEPRETKNGFLINLINKSDDDGVHPVNIGHEIIGFNLYKYLLANNIKANKIVTFGDSITQGVYNLGEGYAVAGGENYSCRLKYYLENQ